jgi:hypothetical protein
MKEEKRAGGREKGKKKTIFSVNTHSIIANLSWGYLKKPDCTALPQSMCALYTEPQEGDHCCISKVYPRCPHRRPS